MTIRQFISGTSLKNGIAPIHVGVSDLAFSSGESELKTTLGSCVAVVLYGPKQNNLCSMSHYLLSSSEGQKPTTLKERRKFGDLIFLEQIEKMEESYGKQAKLFAKVVGGSNVMTSGDNELLKDIGKNNVAMAKSVLLKNNITITGEHTGGFTARALRFFPATNSAWVYEFQSKKEFTI